ncbi:exosome non-catalytic core subunit rrp46 [Coemansia furcata]|uniref:Exosome non-catalytic core subunit rrp46 n=1 Tax=Coemansia furcata TaxID=417177 RepID=A0ACC1LHD4_9FUNG|nr:exosome non-catalytic core subunit rrp46 [Coemansia furcata]
MSRPDRREASQLRALNCSLGQLNRADGSTQFSAGNTSVVSGVYGPVEAKVYEEKLDRAVVEVKFRADIGAPTTKDKWVESAVRSTFEREILAHLHPRTLVQIVIQLREGDGSVDSAAINATTLALVDAGIPLKCMITAATCAVLFDDTTVVDPTQEEIDAARSTHTFAFASGSNDRGPLYVDSRGEFTMDEYSHCYDMCTLATERVLAFMRTAIEGKVTKEAKIGAA